MKISYFTRLNVRKLTKYKSKALFLILPVAVLMSLGIIISSQTQNFLKAAEESIFQSIDAQNTLIKLTKEISFPAGGKGGEFSISINRGGGSLDNTQYTDADIEKLKALENVEDASLISSIPVQNVEAVDLLSNSFSIINLSALKSSVAGLFTDQDFTYTEGEPIPIIVNANTFINEYEQWDGLDTIENDFSAQRNTPGVRQEIKSPVKTEAIAYDKNSIIGKEFTINFGGLSEVPDYKTEPTETGIKFVKLTADEIATAESQRQKDISPYWDYEKIKKPISYKFVVVGVIEEEGSMSTYVPESFASKLMSDSIKYQLDARTSKAIDTSLLNSTFTGITYDGVEFGNAQEFGRNFFKIGIGPGASDSSDSASYAIPGLIIQTERTTSSSNTGNFPGFRNNQATVTGINTNVDVYDEALKSGSTLLIKVDSILNRTSVVKAMNKAGYAYQDTANTDVFNELKATLSNITKGLMVSFVILTTLIVIFTVGKFVSESEKEIGIFRALGATKNDMKMMFIVQAILYTAIGYAIGSAIGVVLMFILSNPVKLWFDSFVGKTIKEAYNVVNPVSPSIFTHINWEAFAFYSILMFVIAVVVSLIPASKASNVSPVRAIRGE